MSLGGRRAGATQAFDVWNNTTGALVKRNVTAAVAVTYATSLTAQAVIDRVAAEHYVVSDGHRVTAHMAISG